MASPQNNENCSDAFTAAKRIHGIYQQVLKTFRKLQGLSQMQGAYMIAIGKDEITKRI